MEGGRCRSGEETSWREEVDDEGGRQEGKVGTRGAHRLAASAVGKGGRGPPWDAPLKQREGNR